MPRTRSLPFVGRVVALIASITLAVACDDPPDTSASAEQPVHETMRDETSTAATSPRLGATTRTAADHAPIVGDAERGKHLVERFECHRCHEGTGLEPMALTRHCFKCHEEISTGKVAANPATLARWKQSVSGLRHVPSLHGAAERFRPDWVADFLQHPQDLRPALTPTMPRLALSPSEAADIAAYVTRGREPDTEATFRGASLADGARLYADKACGRCHSFSGAEVAGGPVDPTTGATESDRKAILLAPDLQHTRDRFRADALEAWLRNPVALKQDTLMPNHGLAPEDARALARFVAEAPLSARPPAGRVARPAAVTTPVAYADVRDRVLSKTCGHCHGNPDVALGDGGPGHTGGFGFPPRKLDLTRYGSMASGYIAGDGERHSIFEPLDDGTPRLVASLLARHDEVNGFTRADVRGMPLGLPPIPLEDIALIDGWIAQGRPR